MKTIVIATGGFDPIHSGHINYIKEAKKLGDVLPIDDCDHASTIQYNTLPYNYDYVMCKIWCSQK